MYCFVDESGNTGNHLFDLNQPYLYYGVLCCRRNLDIIAQPMVKRLRDELGVDRLHANELGVGRLELVYEQFSVFQKKNDVRMNFFMVDKKDHAVISFFDQVFDSGMNDAVPWHHYWSPIRYVLLMKVAHLFDKELAENAWKARLTQTANECEAKLAAICDELIERTAALPDARSRQLIADGLLWAKKNADKISYGVSNSESALQISPNLVGFQQVLQSIAIRSVSMNCRVKSITVDQQTEFNLAQKFINDIYRRMRKIEHEMPPGMPDFDWSTMPDIDIKFKAGSDSVGLEMVDIYLWTLKRLEEDKSMSDAGRNLIYGQRHRGIRDEVSLRGIENRWRFLLDLPEPDVERMEIAKAYLDEAEANRKRVVSEMNS